MLKTLADPAGGRLAVGGGIGTVVLVILYLLLGGDPQALFNSQQQERNYRNLRRSTAKRRTMRHRSSSLSFSPIPKTPGMQIFRQMGREYEEPRLVLFTDRFGPAAGSPVARPVRFIARKIDAFTSTSVFSVYFNNAWVQEAISRRPT